MSLEGVRVIIASSISLAMQNNNKMMKKLKKFQF